MAESVRVIQRADDYLRLDRNREIIGSFLEKYSKCEVLCRPIIRDYLRSIGEYEDNEDIGMELQLIKDALSDAGFIFDDSKLLTRIWGKSKAKGSSSCRFLRNKISHELMERALHEAVEREDELIGDMDKFIEVLTSS